MSKKEKSLDIFEGKKLDYIDVVFENCEVYKIPNTAIETAYIDGLHSFLSIHYNGLRFGKAGEMMNMINCDEVSLIINEEGMNKTGNPNFEEKPFKDRLEFNDITHLDLFFDDGSHLYISVPWEDSDESEFINKFMHVFVKDKAIFIHIFKDVDENVDWGSFDAWYDFNIRDDEVVFDENTAVDSKGITAKRSDGQSEEDEIDPEQSKKRPNDII